MFVVNFHNLDVAHRSSESSFAKFLTEKKVSTVWDTCAILLQDQSSSACIYIAKEHIWQMKHLGINSAPRWEMSGRSLSSLWVSFFPLSFFPIDTCRQAQTSRETTSEKCNLSISASQRKDKQCWKNEGINMLPSWWWTNMSHSLQFTNGARHVQALTGVKIQGQPWFWPLLFVGLFACGAFYLLFDRFSPWVLWSFKMAAEQNNRTEQIFF